MKKDSMVKVNWFLFFRQHVIFGFYLRRSPVPEGLEPHPWEFKWRWGWNDTTASDIRGKPVPWHRCWRWTYVEK